MNSVYLQDMAVSIKPIRLELSAITGGGAGSSSVPLYILETSKNTNTAYFSTGLNFGYSLSDKVTLFFRSSYFSSSKGVTVNIGKRTLSDINKDGVIDLKDIEKFTSSTAGFIKSEKIIKPQYFNYGFGLRYVFGNNTLSTKRKRPGRTKYSNITLERSQIKDTTNNPSGESATARRRRKARKACVKSGGDFVESQDSYICIHKLNYLRTDNPNYESLFRSKKRKCWKAGGNWVTNANGSYCALAKSKRIDQGSTNGDVQIKHGDAKVARTGRNPQTGATIKRLAQNDSIPTKLKRKCLGYTDKSAMMIVKIDQTSLRKTNTKVYKDNTTYINGKRMSIRALRARNGYRAKRVGRVRANDVRARYARAKDARVKDARVKDIRTSVVAGKDQKKTIHSDKPVKTVTGKNNKVKPQTDLNTKYLKIQNNQTIHISKSYLQLIAPYFTCKNSTKTINYSWRIRNKTLNKDDSFKGNNIKYNFNVDGTYEIEITPIINNSSLSPYNIIIICK